MIRQYANSAASTSATTSSGSATHQELNGSSTAAKVAEVFLTAGHAFQKLGDLTLQLHSPKNAANENKWSDEDVDRLKDSLTRFAHELDNIGESVQTRTTKLIKTEIKRRTLTADEMGVPAKRVTTVGQLLAAQGLNSKRTTANSVITGTGSSIASSSHLTSTRPLSYTPRQRYNPVTVVSTTAPPIAATVTLQSSPHPIPPSRAVPNSSMPLEPSKIYLDLPGRR